MSHYLLRGIAVLALVFAIGSTAHAETTTTTSDKDALIKELRARIVVLEAQVAALKGGDQATAGDDAPTWLRPQAFRFGASSEDVKKFQEWLAQMPDIYPEGAVTGFFGPLTRQALIRFQMKNGLTADGDLDEETIAKIKGHLKIKMDNKGPGKPMAPPAVRLGNGKGVPVCVTEDGDHETHFAKTIAEWRKLVSEGAKPGMCKKGNVKEDEDDEDEDEDEDDEDELEIEVRIENGDATVTITIEGETDTFHVDSDDEEDIIDEILERYDELDEDEVEAVIKFEDEDDEDEDEGDDEDEEDEEENN